MRNSRRQHPSILLDIERSFSAHRRRYKIGRSGYPSQLKAKALEAVHGGASHQVVAQAAGVSCRSIKNWLATADEAKVPAPRELILVEEPPSLPRPHSSDGLIQIHLCSGARMEIPISDLTPSVFALLNGGVGC